VIAAEGNPLLRMEAVSIDTDPPAQGSLLLDNFSLTVEQGELVAIVGESGSGKTLAARSVLRLLAPGVRQSHGRILFEGRDLTHMAAQELRAIRGREIGFIMQEPMTALNPGLTVGRQLEEGLRIHTPLSKSERRNACIAMLGRMRIEDPECCFEWYAHQFSGGMRQRILLAAAMLLNPKLLIADEPTTALDPLNQREVLELMVERARQSGTAVILITHNLALVDHYAERVVVLERGRIVETGDASAVLAYPQHPYTMRLVDSLPRRSRAPRAVPPSQEPLLTVRNLGVRYRHRRERGREELRAVDGVTFDVAPGEIVAVVGGSGSGKTTLGRAILALIPNVEGQIKLEGIDPHCAKGDRERAFRTCTQLVFQDPYSSLDPRMRVRDIVSEPLRHTDLARAEHSERIESVLRDVGLQSLGDRFPHELSGGQRQRVAIARALITHPKFVVADEPVSALDATVQAQVLELFRRLQARYGFACLFITHDFALVAELADRVVVLQDGRLVEQGTVEAVFDHPRADYTRALLAATLWPHTPSPRD
jgi:peptide/nickel transport system ATP-binding protein